MSFDVIGASGAGALPGLLYAAPKNKDPVAALKNVVNMNIDDSIYRLCPLNYKVFFKCGPFSRWFWNWGQKLPHFALTPEERYRDSLKRRYNDWLDFMVAAMTPTTLNYFSKGMTTRIVVLVDDLVDWNALRDYPKAYYLNAFNLDKQSLERFDKTKLTPESFYAALAMPWLLPPTTMNQQPYTEGASHDPSGLEALWGDETFFDLDRIIALDTVGIELWNPARNIYEALQIAIMAPIVALAENVLGLYGLVESTVNDTMPSIVKIVENFMKIPSSVRMPRLYIVPFEFPAWEEERTLDWSYSNALTLWNMGYEAAMEFWPKLQQAINQSRDDAKTEGDDPLKDYRYWPYIVKHRRWQELDPLFRGVGEDDQRPPENRG